MIEEEKIRKKLLQGQEKETELNKKIAEKKDIRFRVKR